MFYSIRLWASNPITLKLEIKNSKEQFFFKLSIFKCTSAYTKFVHYRKLLGEDSRPH